MADGKSGDWPELDWPKPSLLDGPYAREWEALGLGQLGVSFNATATQASHRATTSSRTPGHINRGTVYARKFEHDPRDFHLCGCGQRQSLCLGCLTWVCNAPGHIVHACSVPK